MLLRHPLFPKKCDKNILYIYTIKERRDNMEKEDKKLQEAVVFHEDKKPTEAVVFHDKDDCCF